MNFVNWVNKYNGFFMVILTAIYVICTIIICRSNYRSAKECRLQLEESRKQFNESNRPNIIPSYSIVEGSIFCLSFKNIGNQYAKNIKINIDENWLNIYDEARKKISNSLDVRAVLNNSFFLAPESDIKLNLTIVGNVTNIFKEISKEKIKLKITYYTNDCLRMFSEDFEVDLSVMGSLMLEKSDYLRKTEKEHEILRKIVTKLDKIAASINQINSDE